MKTNKFFLVAFAALLMHSTVSFADDRMIPAEQLPAAAQTFVKKTFPNSAIVYAEKDGYANPTYEVRLMNGTKVEFDRKGAWEKVDTQLEPVPAHLIPTAIAKYVKTNFPDTQIVKIDKEPYGFEIELSNDLDLKFNKAGALIAMDD
jgi:hypothetical protein